MKNTITMAAAITAALVAMAPALMAQDAAPAAPGGEQGGHHHAMGAGGFIKHFDTDNDGKVSKAEFKGPAEKFTELDKNGDGFITADEVPQAPAGGMHEGFIKHFDTDNDGKVSKAEFKGPAEKFTELDKNADGFISADEAPKGPPAGAHGGHHGEHGGTAPAAPAK